MIQLTPLLGNTVSEVPGLLNPYTPPLEGKCYNTFLIEKDGIRYLVKILKRKAANNQLLTKLTFEKHQREHQLVSQIFEGTNFILTTIYFELEYLNEIEYANIQPFIHNALNQYKLILRGSELRTLPINVLQGIIANRALFMDRIKHLLAKIKPNLIDLDFFIIDQDPWILVFDTTEFWPEKREGKDQMQIESDLEDFFNKVQSILGSHN